MSVDKQIVGETIDRGGVVLTGIYKDSVRFFLQSEVRNHDV